MTDRDLSALLQKLHDALASRGTLDPEDEALAALVRADLDRTLEKAAVAPTFSASPRVSASPRSSMSPSASFAPSEAARSASERPMPEPAPVMTTTLSLSDFMIPGLAVS